MIPTESLFTRLLASRKAVLLLVALLVVGLLTALGRVPPAQFMTFLTVSFPTWLAAQGLEDALVKPAGIAAASAAADREAAVVPSSPTPAQD